MKSIESSEEAKNDIRAITKRIPLNVLAAIHRLAEYGSGRVKSLNMEQVPSYPLEDSRDPAA